MSRILIAGDSWGCGEWNVDCTQVVHAGLQHYLQQDGHTVTNISRGGTSNLDNYMRLRMWFERNIDHEIETVLIFQTDPMRDHKHAVTTDWNCDSLSNLVAQWIERFYMRLHELAAEQQCKIQIIGGLSDTVQFQNMNKDYPGCEIVCQSLTNLLVNDSDQIDIPVHSWYDRQSKPVIEKVKQLDTDIQQILDLVDLGFEREALVRSNPQWFYPDGIHPNRGAHLKLYEFLQHKNCFD